MSDIHPTAIIDDSVKLGDKVKIGPYCCLTGNVDLGDEVVLESHVIVTGNTKVGAQTHIYPFASIGHVPQDLKFGDEEVFLEIGARNRIREHVTMNPGTQGGGRPSTASGMLANGYPRRHSTPQARRYGF